MKLRFVTDLLAYMTSKYKDIYIFSGVRENTTIEYDIQEYSRISFNVAEYLISQGLMPRDFVLSISENRPEWNFTDMGIMLACGIHVPVSPTLSEKELIYVINQTSPRYVFISSKFVLRRIQEIADHLEHIPEFVSFEKLQGTTYFHDIANNNHSICKDEIIIRQKQLITPEDTATLIYTSGSTGMPKGVMLSHQNLISGFIDMHYYFALGSGSRNLSYLPLSHSFERWMNYVFQFSGITVAYADYSKNIISNLECIRPDSFATVPLFLEKICELSSHDGNPYQAEPNVNTQLKNISKHGFLGGKIKMIFCAGASLNMGIFSFFKDLNIPVYEIYGSSETMVIAFNCLLYMRQGSVGKIKPGCRIKLSSENEILLKGDMIMKGYYNLPQETASAIDQYSWYHTGDIGELDPDGYLRIRGRMTDLFKTSSGAFISPVLIENILLKSPYIKFALVFGENRSNLGVIIIPDYDSGEINDKELVSNSDQAFPSPTLKEAIYKCVEIYNQEAVGTETISHIIILPDDWTTENECLTSSLKIRRKFLIEKYKDMINKQYS